MIPTPRWAKGRHRCHDVSTVNASSGSARPVVAAVGFLSRSLRVAGVALGAPKRGVYLWMGVSILLWGALFGIFGGALVSVAAVRTGPELAPPGVPWRDPGGLAGMLSHEDRTRPQPLGRALVYAASVFLIEGGARR